MPEEVAKSLDDVLKSWDNTDEGKSEMKAMSTRLTKLEEENTSLKEGAEARKEADAKAAEQAAYKEDIKPVLKVLQKDGFKYPDEDTEQWINARAVSDKKLAKAWDKREEDPEAFDKMIEELAPVFQKSVTKNAKLLLDVKDDPEPENKATDGDKGAARATRIARGTNEAGSDNYENVDWGGLSGSDFAREAEKVYADMRSGKLKPE